MGRLKNFKDFAGRSLLNEVFIETGTFRGETLDAAVAAGFKTVHSIDVVPSYAAKAKERHKDNPNVFCHAGTSPDILPKILDKSKGTTFWLDAHYQNHADEENCNKYGQCPLLAELKVIFSIAWEKPPTVLIDDAHMFDGKKENKKPSYKIEQWPLQKEIEKLVPHGYKIKNHDNILIISHV